MRFPWVSRAAYDAVIDLHDRQVDQTRALMAELAAERERYERLVMTLHQPAPVVQPTEPPPLPGSIVDALNQLELYGLERLRHEEVARRLLAEGQTPETVRRVLFAGDVVEH